MERVSARKTTLERVVRVLLLASVLTLLPMVLARADDNAAGPANGAVPVGAAVDSANVSANAGARESDGAVVHPLAGDGAVKNATPDDEEVVLSESLYANREEKLITGVKAGKDQEKKEPHVVRLLDRSDVDRAHCDCGSLSCPAGNFCAWGTKPRSSTKNVAVYIDGQLVAIEGDASNPEEVAVSRLCKATSNARKVWFVSVPSGELPGGSVITAAEVDADKQVLKRGTAARTSLFTIDGDAVGRTGSPNGSLGAGIGIASMTRSVNAHDVEKGPQPNNVSPWIFGVRYELALFSQDWLHRLSLVADYEWKLGHWSLIPGLALGGGVGAQTSGGASITAGLLAGASFRATGQVTPQIAGVIGVESQGFFSNGTTLWLNTVYGGPEVSF